MNNIAESGSLQMDVESQGVSTVILNDPVDNK